MVLVALMLVGFLPAVLRLNNYDVCCLPFLESTRAPRVCLVVVCLWVRCLSLWELQQCLEVLLSFLAFSTASLDLLSFLLYQTRYSASAVLSLEETLLMTMNLI